jgi:hypothetical protein
MNSRRMLIKLPLLMLLLLQTPWIFSQTMKPNYEKFRHERVIMPGGKGPNRLLIDAEMLKGSDSKWELTRQVAGSEREPMTLAAGGLNDLRIYDALQREVPYLMMMPPMPESKWQEGHLAPMALTKKTSGFQLDLGSAHRIDRLRLNGLPAPFVKRCILEAGLDASHWIVLRSEATVFDLPSQSLRSVEIEFERGDYRYLKVTWDDNASAPIPLPKSVSARLISAGSLPAGLQTSILFEQRRCEPGVSRYRLKLAGPHLPITEIRLTVNGGNILRNARITEARLAGLEISPTTLGTATLRREVRGELAASELSIPIESPQESQLELVIEDGNNPALDITGISARYAYLPWIYFESTDAQPLTARYGYRDLPSPRYDLEAARESVAKNITAEARWGEKRDKEPVKETSGGTGLAAVGAAIDLTSFRYARAISANTGLSSLPLDAAVLAHSKMGDIRIARPDGRQVPYILEKVEEPLSLDLPKPIKIKPPQSKSFADKTGTATRSYYRLHFPFSDLPGAQLVLATSANVFQRNLSIVIERNPYNERQEPWTESIVQTLWSHADPEMTAPALSLAIPSLKATEAMLVIEDGDNSPLPIISAKLLLPAYRLRFFCEADMKLYYGRSDLAAPRYDIAILAPRLMGAAAEEIRLGPENGSTAQEPRSLSSKLFWGFLIGAVVILLILIVRLIKKV